MSKLTPTMYEGLKVMAGKLLRQPSVLSYPNENTGKALLKRGLIEYVETRDGWRRYVLTDAGRAALAEPSP